VLVKRLARWREPVEGLASAAGPVATVEIQCEDREQEWQPLLDRDVANVGRHDVPEQVRVAFDRDTVRMPSTPTA
jgi:hypothetical protein